MPPGLPPRTFRSNTAARPGWSTDSSPSTPFPAAAEAGERVFADVADLLDHVR